MTKLQQLADLGQSIWYDNIRRALLDSGELQALVEAGVTGVTSNPSIFEKAIAGSADYDQALGEIVSQGKSEEEIFEALAIKDIQRTADLLRRVYNQTHGADGNVMIKVPATPAGIPAIETLIGEGITVNVTLMFSLAHYNGVAERLDPARSLFIVSTVVGGLKELTEGLA